MREEKKWWDDFEKRTNEEYAKKERKAARAEAKVAALLAQDAKNTKQRQKKEERDRARNNQAHWARLAADARCKSNFKAQEKARGGEPPRDLSDENLPEISDEGEPSAKRRVFGPRPPPIRFKPKRPRMIAPVHSDECPDSEEDKALSDKHERLTSKIRKLGGQRGPKTPDRLR